MITLFVHGLLFDLYNPNAPVLLTLLGLIKYYFTFVNLTMCFFLVLYYSATILEAAGLSNSASTIIWITAGISFANVLSTIPGIHNYNLFLMKQLLKAFL